MTQINVKRVYEAAEESDGYRVLIDRLWPRGIKKGDLEYNYWAKDLAPTAELRRWFHMDQKGRWTEFTEKYKSELCLSAYVGEFLKQVKDKPVITLLYAAKDTEHNQANILKDYLEKKMNS